MSTHPMNVKLTLPTIHMNGTGGLALTTSYVAAMDALRVAREALQQTAPHGRDYYPQGDDAFKRAAEEHRNRVAAIISIMSQLETLALHTSGAN